MITLTEEQFKEMIEAAHRAGQRNQGHCDPSAYEAMVYYEREVKKLIIPDVSVNEVAVCPRCKSKEVSVKPVTYDCYECGAMRSCAMHCRIKLARTLLAHDV